MPTATLTNPHQTQRQPAAARPAVLLELRAEPGVDLHQALRAALKALLRRHGLRCTAIREVNHD